MLVGEAFAAITASGRGQPARQVTSRCDFACRMSTYPEVSAVAKFGGVIRNF